MICDLGFEKINKNRKGEPNPLFIITVCIFSISGLTVSEAVKALDDLPSEVLIDGDRIPEYLSLLQQEGSCNVRTIVGGDGKEVTIAAASIIAKCSRDQMMVEYSRIYPHYEFEVNSLNCIVMIDMSYFNDQITNNSLSALPLLQTYHHLLLET